MYKANQSTNSPFKLEIVLLKLAHLLGPLKQKTNSSTRDHPISNHRVVNTRPWRPCPYMGSYSNMVKMQILEGYANFKGLLAFLGLKWNGKPFVIGFCQLFWTWPCTTFNSIPNILKLLTNRDIALIYSVIICEQKTKDCAPQSKLTYSTIAFNFDVCRIS